LIEKRQCGSGSGVDDLILHGETVLPLCECYSESSFKITQAGISTAMTQDILTISPGSRFRAAMMLAVVADALQIIVFPFFVEGALSPADDILDLGIGALMVRLLGWHWEFLPSFLAKLVPGVDLIPFWTMAVANVYRKSKRIAVSAEESREQHPALRD
jgi:hypothetical protein